MELIIVLLIVGVVLALFPVDERIKQLIYAILVVLVLLWVLSAFGVLSFPTLTFRR